MDQAPGREKKGSPLEQAYNYFTSRVKSRCGEIPRSRSSRGTDFVNRRKLDCVDREKRILWVAFSRKKVDFRRKTSRMLVLPQVKRSWALVTLGLLLG